MKNKVKQKLKEGKAVMGALVTVNDPLTLHVMANAGFDYLLVDTQHSVIGTDTLFSIIKGLNPTESAVIVRVIWNDRALINQAFDFGNFTIYFVILYSKIYIYIYIYRLYIFY